MIQHLPLSLLPYRPNQNQTFPKSRSSYHGTSPLPQDLTPRFPAAILFFPREKPEGSSCSAGPTQSLRIQNTPWRPRALGKEPEALSWPSGKVWSLVCPSGFKPCPPLCVTDTLASVTAHSLLPPDLGACCSLREEHPVSLIVDLVKSSLSFSFSLSVTSWGHVRVLQHMFYVTTVTVQDDVINACHLH